MTLELCITTSAVFSEWNRYKLENAFGENKNANKSNLGGIPGLIAGSFDLSFLKKHTFAYAILLRQNFDMNVGYREEVYSDVIDQFPGALGLRCPSTEVASTSAPNGFLM